MLKNRYFRPCRRRGGGSRGSLEPSFWTPKDFIYTALTVHFKCLTIGKWSTSSLDAIENHRCPSKSGCCYAGLFLEGQPRTRAREWSRRCDGKLRPRVNTCVNKSLRMSGAREFTSCPSIDVTPPTVLPTSVPSLVEIWSQVAQQMHVGQPKIEWNSSYCFCPKMAPEAISEHLISKNFLGEHPPRPP